MEVIDTDAHVEEWAETFSDKYLEEPFRARRPQIITSNKRPYWLVEDNVLPKIFGRGCYFFATPTGYGSTINETAATKPETYESQELRDVKARLRDMDKEKIDLQVIYPTLFVCAYSLTSDPQLEAALYRSYNSWMADVVSQEARLRWVAIVTLTDVGAASAEVRRAKQLGAIGVMTLGTVLDQQLDEPQFDPFYSLLEELNLPLAVHVGWSSPSLTNLFSYNFASLSYPFRAGVHMAFVHMVGGGVFDRHPKLKVGYFEAGISWVPYFLDVMDTYAKLKLRKPGIPAMEYRAQLRPIDYVRSGQLYFSAEEPETLFAASVDVVGEDTLLWASDIPHADRDPDALREFLEGPILTDAQKQKMLSTNARRFYGL